MLLHGSGCSNCSSVLALNIEVGDKRLSFSAKHLLQVKFGMLTGKYLQRDHMLTDAKCITKQCCKGNRLSN